MARKGDTPEIIAARKAWNEASAVVTKLSFHYRPFMEEEYNLAMKAQQEAWVAYSTMLREIGQLPALGATIEITG